MIEIRGIIIDLKSNVYKTFTSPLRSFLKEFNTIQGFTYDVSLDQSNSCTGFHMESLDGTIYITIEVVNVGIAFEFYRNGLLTFLKHMLEGVDVRYCIIEKPLPYVSNQRNRALEALKKLLDEFFTDYPTLNIKKFDSIFPQSWRSGIIPKDYKGDKRSKKATVDEICKRYPLMENFKSVTYNPSNNGGYDGFESCGILEGYKNRHEISDDNDLTKIIGPVNTLKVGFSIFVYATPNDSMLENCIKIIQENSKDLQNPVTKIYNEEGGVYANSKMSLVDDFTVTLITKRVDVKAVLLRYSMKYVPNKIMYMITIPLNKLRDSMLQALIEGGYRTEVFY